MSAVAKSGRIASKRDVSSDDDTDLEVTSRGALKKDSKDILSSDAARNVLKAFVEIQEGRFSRKK